MSQSVQLIGVKETLRQLQAVQPEVYKQMVADVKVIMQPAISAIEARVPKVSPLYSVRRGKNGMEHNGRSAYAPVKVTPRVTPSGTTSIGTEAKFVQIEIMSIGKFYGFELIDMAGRGTGRGRRPKNITREYEWKNKTRKHILNGQGEAMIRKLNTVSSKPSRYAYPAVQDSFPRVQAQILRTIDTATGTINRKLERF